ncbi:MAG: baseplate assembly protein [Magnetococcales bacterium]|nr:baseplate assembly protein [Magnetococcales bacterium]
MANEIELFGQDIALGVDLSAPLAANGETLLAQGAATALQDIKLRLFTPLGSLFYDKDFGSLIHQFIKDENTTTNRMALATEVQFRIELDPRVEPQSCRVSILSWNHLSVKIQAWFRLVNISHPFNLVIQADSDKEMVITDVDPR